MLEVINESGTNYAQKHWVDRMVWLAKRKYHADWIINADADEFWYSPIGLKIEMSNSFANVLSAHPRNVLPEHGKHWSEWCNTVSEVVDGKSYGLSRYSIFSRHRKKVCHRADGYIQISMGNHKVAMFPKLEKSSQIVIYHYIVRDKQHFLTKMINGGKQLEQNKSKRVGRHWRYYYNLYKNGQLEQEYNRVIGTTCYEQLLNDGYIHCNNVVPDILQSLL